MEPGEGNGALIIPNGLMEIWDATEEDLYRAGMENLRRKDKCFAVDMLSFIRGAVSAEDEEEMRAVHEPETADWSDYNSFDNFMCRFLV